MAVLVQILDGQTGEVLRSIDTVEDGSVTLDSAAAIRGRCEITVIDDGLLDLIPMSPFDDVAPYGNEIRVARGVRYSDGLAEAVSLGIFRIRRVDPVEQAGNLSMKITGLDRWSRIIDARFEQTWVIPEGTNYVTAITNTLRQAWPDIPLDLGTTTLTTPLRIAERGGDRGQFVRDMATAIGRELIFDGDGVLRSQPIALANGEVDWTFSEGPGGVLLRAGRAWDAERVYNRVIVSGEPMDDSLPVCGKATDVNPQSPTYYYGPFGQRPRFYSSPLITTTEQANNAAAGILAGALGTTQQVEFGTVVNPAVQPGDLTEIVRERLGLNERHVVDEITIPLSASAEMTGRTRVAEVLGS